MYQKAGRIGNACECREPQNYHPWIKYVQRYNLARQSIKDDTNNCFCTTLFVHICFGTDIPQCCVVWYRNIPKWYRKVPKFGGCQKPSVGSFAWYGGTSTTTTIPYHSIVPPCPFLSLSTPGHSCVRFGFLCVLPLRPISLRGNFFLVRYFTDGIPISVGMKFTG
jgi:hypothetical protein